MNIGINATKDAVFIAETTGDRGHFAISKITRMQFAFARVADMADLLKTLKTLLDTLSEADPRVAILCCSSGRFGASLEAIKAEALAQLAAHESGYDVVDVKPQSLKSLLGCTKEERWQAKSKDIFNADGYHKHWSEGANGAVAAAYKLAE